MTAYLLPFVVALIVSGVLTGLVRIVAPKLGLVDVPRQDRWHRRPVPRLGGIAIYLAFVTASLFVLHRPLSGERLALLLGGTLIFLVGAIDDLVRLENRPKLLLLILCAVIPALLGVRFELLPAVIGTPLAILWILGSTNAFNWLDNMDGVAAGIAVIASGNLILLSILYGGEEAARLAAILAGAALGFLIHNFPPARIFMGDGGSGFLGFTIATIAVIGSYKEVSNVLLIVLVPGLIMSVPIFDTAMVTLLRALHRRSILQGGRDHPAHRLVAMGLPERKVVAMLYGLGALAGSLALATSFLGFLGGMSLSIVVMLAFVAFGLVLAEVRVYEGPVPRDGHLTPLPRPFWNMRWIFVMLIDVALVSVAYISAHLLRYEGQLPALVANDVARTLPLILAAKMLGFYLAGIYRGAWRYAGVMDVVRLAEGVTVGSLLGVGALFLWTRVEGFSRAALILDWLLTLLLLTGSRL
ncbi:MAG TPA: hypothetical protein VFL31_05430, partial [Nitrospiraceae bacterium]|nr:hypothetical protein [Nitrospiraceae bacterium]